MFKILKIKRKFLIRGSGLIEDFDKNISCFENIISIARPCLDRECVVNLIHGQFIAKLEFHFRPSLGSRSYRKMECFSPQTTQSARVGQT